MNRTLRALVGAIFIIVLVAVEDAVRVAVGHEGVRVVVHADLAFSGIGVALGAGARVQRNGAALD